MKKNIKKKASVPQDIVLFLMMIVLVLFALFQGIKLKDSIHLSVGDNAKHILQATVDAEKFLGYLDELARQSLLNSLKEFSLSLGKEECGNYLDYGLLNVKDNSIDCSISLQQKFQNIAEEQLFFGLEESAMDSDYSSRLEEKENSIVFSGRSNTNKVFSSQNAEYTIIPSFEIRLDYNFSDFEKLGSFVSTASACKSEGCMAEAAKKQSTQDLNFVFGNCDEYDFFSDLIEQVHDCIDSKDNDCTCEIKTTEHNNYKAEFSNANSKLKITLYHKDNMLNLFSKFDTAQNLDSVKVANDFAIPFMEDKKYIKKSGSTISSVSSPEKQCAIEKPHRFCAIANKEFYFYDVSENKLKKENLTYKFAIFPGNQVSIPGSSLSDQTKEKPAESKITILGNSHIVAMKSKYLSGDKLIFEDSIANSDSVDCVKSSNCDLFSYSGRTLTDMKNTIVLIIAEMDKLGSNSAIIYEGTNSICAYSGNMETIKSQLSDIVSNLHSSNKKAYISEMPLAMVGAKDGCSFLTQENVDSYNSLIKDVGADGVIEAKNVPFGTENTIHSYAPETFSYLHDKFTAVLNDGQI